MIAMVGVCSNHPQNLIIFTPQMKNLLLFLTIICLTTQVTTAQKRGQARVDSLLQDVEVSKVDTHQAAVLIDLSFTYNTIDPDKGISYGTQGLAMAEKLRWKEGLIDAYRALGVNRSFGKSEFNE